MKQTKLESFIETCMNVSIGFCISYAAWPIVAKLHGLPYGAAQAFSITMIFTVLSITRGYVIRRWFNAGLHAAAVELAAKLRKEK